MRAFASDSSNHGTTMRSGFWKFSRHPNYLGEISFWLGLFLMAVAGGNYPVWLFICPLSMYLMFALVTCKMMDDRSLERRSDYAEYMQKTSQLFLWPPTK
jgi:steroid 5-alpha reductase family enzyme